MNVVIRLGSLAEEDMAWGFLRQASGVRRQATPIHIMAARTAIQNVERFIVASFPGIGANRTTGFAEVGINPFHVCHRHGYAAASIGLRFLLSNASRCISRWLGQFGNLDAFLSQSSETGKSHLVF